MKVNIITSAGKSHITVKCKNNITVINNNSCYKKWFDPECNVQRYSFFESVKRYKDSNLDEHRIIMSKERSVLDACAELTKVCLTEVK